MKQSGIGWADYSGGNLNFVTGCTPVSEGCRECYARAIYDRFGRDFTPTFHQDKLDALFTMKFPEFSPKRGAPHKPMCFVVDTGDLFHEAIETIHIRMAFNVMNHRQDITWLVLTKRPERIQAALGTLCNYTIPNIWLGITAENQARYNERVGILGDNWSGRCFVSIEPMLEPIRLWDTAHCGRIQWVIVGAESGPHRRPFQVEWAEDIYEQCQTAGVPFFGKQDSGLYPGTPLLIEGREIHEFPESR